MSLDTRAVVFYMILEYLSVKEGTTAFRVPPMKLPCAFWWGEPPKVHTCDPELAIHLVPPSPGPM